MSFHHEAVLYAGGPDGFARAVAPLVGEALAAGGCAAVAAPQDRLDRLSAVLGAPERLTLLEMTEVGANPARIIPVWRELADAALAGGAPFVGVGEPIWAGRTDDEVEECHRHEALINLAFGEDPPWRLVCPYDADALAPDVLEAARATHPVVVDAHGGRHETPRDRLALDLPGRPLAPVPAHAAVLGFTRAHLPEVRRLAQEQARAAGLGEERAGDLVLVVTELATNAVRHGGGSGTLSLWAAEGAVVCQTTDRGWIRDPLVGRRRPGVELPSGRGMWIVQQVADLVQVRTGPAGTTVRATVREPARRPAGLSA